MTDQSMTDPSISETDQLSIPPAHSFVQKQSHIKDKKTIFANQKQIIEQTFSQLDIKLTLDNELVPEIFNELIQLHKL